MFILKSLLSSFNPEHISPAKARKLCGIKVSRGEKAKEVVLNYLLENEKAFTIEYTSRGNPRPVSYDRADSLIIARAGHKTINS